MIRRRGRRRELFKFKTLAQAERVLERVSNLMADREECEMERHSIQDRRAEIAQQRLECQALGKPPEEWPRFPPAEDVALPATVQSVLAARIDRLPEREKRLLQTASVIGKKFSEPILKRVADLGDGDLPAALHALTSAELLYQGVLSPEAEYAFKSIQVRSRRRAQAGHGAFRRREGPDGPLRLACPSL